MVLYTCKKCQKTFIDKTKFTVHLNKKRPCTKDSNEIGNEDDNDDKVEKNNKINDYLSKCTIDTTITGKTIGKNECQSVEKNFASICRLCKKTYDDLYINHLVNEHKIQKEEHIFSFILKTSGVIIYEDEKECGDIVLLVFDENKALYFVTKNLHNLQRHKKEKYRDIQFCYYYPCKDIKMFKVEFSKRCKLYNIKEDEKLDVKEIEPIIYDILVKINKNTIEENKELKVNANFRSSVYYICPFCDFTHNEKTGINVHLIESHKYLKHNSLLSIDDEQKEKIINMIENNTFNEKNNLNLVELEEVRCDYCNSLFSNKFNLRRHLKMNCKKYQILMQNNLLRDNDTLKEDLFQLIEKNEKLLQENKVLKEALVTNQEQLSDQNETLKNSVNYISKTTNIIQNNNIMFNINDFGNEDLSHIDNGFVEEVIKQMSTNSLIRFIEEVHYGNPKNCNVIIPTNIPAIQDNNLLLLKKGNKWVLDKRKNVIDDMLTMNIDRITDAYEDLQPKLTNIEKTGFENYVSDMENTNQNGFRTTAIEMTEELIKSKQPKNFMLENLRVQQNNFIEGEWKDSVDYQIPQKMVKIENIEKSQLNDFLERPIEMNLKDNINFSTESFIFMENDNSFSKDKKFNI